MHMGLTLLLDPDASLATMLDPNMVARPKHGCQTKALGPDVFVKPKVFGSRMVDRLKTLESWMVDNASGVVAAIKPDPRC